MSCLLRAADFSMQTSPLQCLPILPPLLHQLCHLTHSLGALGPALRVCLTFGFFAMLRQSNLAPPSDTLFDPSRHTCRGDVFFAPQGPRGGPRLISRWGGRPYYPSWKYRDIPATESQPIFSYSPHPTPRHRTNHFSPTSSRGVSTWSQSLSCPEH